MLDIKHFTVLQVTISEATFRLESLGGGIQTLPLDRARGSFRAV